MEDRTLLSGFASELARPGYILYHPAGAAGPLASPAPTGYTPAQVRHAYGFDQITFPGGVAGDGSGTTIAIVDAYDDPNVGNDLHQFDLQFGLKDPTFTKVNQSGGSQPPQADPGWASEIALDVEWSHAIAPGANILLVEASDSSYGNLLAGVSYAARQPGVVAVSMSWGGSEFSGETSYDSTFVTPSGHSGVTFIAASGDSGAPPGYPAVSPNVLAAGGTTLNLDSSGNYVSESGWSGSGGGVSSVESQPAYQHGVVTQSSTARANPDVAYDADPNTGFPVYDSYNNGSSVPWSQFGGTSAASPQWASLIAITDQGRALAGEGALDGVSQTLPKLYQLPAADFHDVTSGNNGYSAGPGYDLVTGRGSPVANKIVADLVGTATTTATHFTVSAPASATAGAPFSITITALDQNNKAVTGYTGTVHFTSSDTTAGLPADYTFTTADNGSHTFTNGVTLKKAGSDTITVSDTFASTISGSATVAVTPAAADHLSFAQQPTNAVAGNVISPAVTVQVFDPYNNPVATDQTDAVTLAIGTNPGGGTLSGTLTATVSNGVATFSNVSINKTGTGYTLTASSGTLGRGTSAAFTITPGRASRLAFGQQPTSTPAGTSITPAVTVQILDANGNLVSTDNTDTVTIGLGANPGGATLSGTLTVTARGGVATFSDLALNKAGTGYTLVASNGSLGAVDSGTASLAGQTAPAYDWTIAARPSGAGYDMGAYELQQGSAPAAAVAGTAAGVAGQTLAFYVAANEAASQGNTSFTYRIDWDGDGTVDQTVSSTGGAALTHVYAAAGTYTIHVTATDGASHTSPAATFSVAVAAPTRTPQTYYVSPSGSDSAAGTAAAPWLTLQHAANTVQAGDTVIVAPGHYAGFTLTASGTAAAPILFFAAQSNVTISTPLAAGDGIELQNASYVTLQGLWLSALQGGIHIQGGAGDVVRAGYFYETNRWAVWLDNTSAATVEASSINIAGAGGQAAILATASANAHITDNLFDQIQSSAGIALAQGSTGAVVANNTVILNTGWALAVQGASTGATLFNNILMTSTLGVGGSLSATADSLSGLTSDYNAGYDRMSADGGATVETLAQWQAATGQDGHSFVSTMNALFVNPSGHNYQLQASGGGGGLGSTTSNAFNITPAGTHLVFSQQPTNVAAGSAISPAVTVEVLDANNNLVTTDSSDRITLALGANPSGGTLSGTLTVTVSNGIATFNNLSINKTGTGYTLTASSGTLTGTTSSQFTVTPGAATHLSFSQPPTSAVAGSAISPAVTVQVLDANNNLVTTDSTDAIAMTIGTNPGGGTLSGTTTVTVSKGVATFSNLSINKTGTGYTLKASSGSLTSATSGTFNITAGKADHLAFAQQPSNTAIGAPITPAVTVQVQDANNNLVTTDNTDTVTLTLANNPTGATLGGTTTVTVSGGVATFAGLSVNKAGTGYTLGASSGSLRSATSAAFTVSGATTFNATDVPQSIDPFDVYTFSTINVAQSLSIASVKVQLNIAYPYDGDLTIDLIAPDGTDVALSYWQGNYGANFQNTIFDDAASTPISAGSPPFAGSYKPQSPLSAVAGKNAQGPWQLEIIDWGSGFGTLKAWSLIVNPAGGASLRSAGDGAPTAGGSGTGTVVALPPAGLTAPAPATATPAATGTSFGGPTTAFGSPGLVVADLSTAMPIVSPPKAAAMPTTAATAVVTGPTAIAAAPRPAESVPVESGGAELMPDLLPGPAEAPAAVEPSAPENGPGFSPPPVDFAPDRIPDSVGDWADDTPAAPEAWNRACDVCFAGDQREFAPAALAGEPTDWWQRAAATAAVALLLHRSPPRGDHRDAPPGWYRRQS